MSKFMVEYTARMTGDPDKNIEVASRLITSFDRWQEPDGLKLLFAFDRLDGASGYLLLETENATSLTEILARFIPFAEFEIHPVVDFDDSLPVIRESLEWARSVGF